MTTNGNHHTQEIVHSRIAIDAGTHLQVQVGQLPGRVESTLIGICPDKYLIISMPRGANPHASGLTEIGTPLIVRYIHNGNAYGFSSAVLHTISKPEKLLFISHPVQLEVYELRNYPRVSCLLPARARVDGHLFDGAVVDISRTGARFAFAANSASSQLVKLIDADIQLDIQFPGATGYTHTLGKLRDILAGSDKVYLGTSLDEVEGPQLANLLSFLLDADAMPEHYSLSDIIHKHSNWINSVSRYMLATEDVTPEFALSHNDCALGKWLNSSGKAKYGNTAEYQQLYETHQRLHDEVTAVTRLRQEGDKEAALERFNKVDIKHLSNRIAALLIAADEHQSKASEAAGKASAIPDEPPVADDAPPPATAPTAEQPAAEQEPASE